MAKRGKSNSRDADHRAEILITLPACDLIGQQARRIVDDPLLILLLVADLHLDIEAPALTIDGAQIQNRTLLEHVIFLELGIEHLDLGDSLPIGEVQNCVQKRTQNRLVTTTTEHDLKDDVIHEQRMLHLTILPESEKCGKSVASWNAQNAGGTAFVSQTPLLDQKKTMPSARMAASTSNTTGAP